MRKVKLIAVLLLSFALVMVVAQNTAPIEARFLWLTAEVPAILLLFLTAVGGFVVGILTSLLIGRAHQKK
ncbi:MAG: LapA family protein [Spirochaeta sp.]|nr:LapA family protein [Spirochaeta sp.]